MDIFHFHSAKEMHEIFKNNRKDKAFKGCLALYDMKWNDYGYHTKFGLYYIDHVGEIEEIGSLKLTYKGYRNYRDFKSIKPATKLGYGKVVLTSEYCSIGETMEYYSNIERVFRKDNQRVLSLLCDASVYESIAKAFEEEPSYRGSLLRESSSNKALYTVRSNIISEKREIDMSFQYLFHPPYSSIPSDQELFRFSFAKSVLPYRINVIVGKNGAGKTQLLKDISESLSGITGVGASSQSSIKGKRPIVDRVIALSYSAFDDVFQDRIEGRKSSSVSYIYCGIHSKGHLLTPREIADNFKKSYKCIKDKERLIQWHKIMNALFESEQSEKLNEVVNKGIWEVPLSSGQRVLISTITETIANIEPGSLILIDELELHLHPNAISNAVRMLMTLLETFDSYAIIATHSPLIVQEIPSRYIQVMNRIDNILSVYTPQMEYFGDNVTSITDEVFGVLECF